MGVGPTMADLQSARKAPISRGKRGFSRVGAYLVAVKPATAPPDPDLRHDPRQVGRPARADPGGHRGDGQGGGRRAIGAACILGSFQRIYWTDRCGPQGGTSTHFISRVAGKLQRQTVGIDTLPGPPQKESGNRPEPRSCRGFA